MTTPLVQNEMDGIDLVDSLCFAIEARAAGQSGEHAIAEHKAEMIRRLSRLETLTEAAEALAGSGEPVAWMDEGGSVWDTRESASEWCDKTEPRPLYTTPSRAGGGEVGEAFTMREVVQALTQHYKDQSGEQRHVPATLMAFETMQSLRRIIETNRDAALHGAGARGGSE